MESGLISDEQISASSEYDTYLKAVYGRLNHKPTGPIKGAWSALRNDKSQWLQVDLSNHYTTVTGVATQGRYKHNQWVTRYKLQYSADGVNFHYYWEQGPSKEKVKATTKTKPPLSVGGQLLITCSQFQCNEYGLAERSALWNSLC